MHRRRAGLRVLQKNSCLDCHSRLEGPAGDAARQFDGDIHKARGLSCNDCHGGDPTASDRAAAEDPRKGFLPRLKPGEVLRVDFLAPDVVSTGK